MFYSKKLKKIKQIKHCFFSRRNGFSQGIYKGLNCGRGSKDKKANSKRTGTFQHSTRVNTFSMMSIIRINQAPQIELNLRDRVDRTHRWLVGMKALFPDELTLIKPSR